MRNSRKPPQGEMWHYIVSYVLSVSDSRYYQPAVRTVRVSAHTAVDARNFVRNDMGESVVIRRVEFNADIGSYYGYECYLDAYGRPKTANAVARRPWYPAKSTRV